MFRKLQGKRVVVMRDVNARLKETARIEITNVFSFWSEWNHSVYVTGCMQRRLLIGTLMFKEYILCYMCASENSE